MRFKRNRGIAAIAAEILAVKSGTLSVGPAQADQAIEWVPRPEELLKDVPSEDVAGILMFLQQVSEALDDLAAATGATEQPPVASAIDYYNSDTFYGVNCADRCPTSASPVRQRLRSSTGRRR